MLGMSYYTDTCNFDGRIRPRYAVHRSGGSRGGACAPPQSSQFPFVLHYVFVLLPKN